MRNLPVSQRRISLYRLCGEPFLALRRLVGNITDMKLTAAIVVHLALITAFVWGILLLVQGKPALLLGAIAVYAVIFGKIGCAAH